jgi:hypothetical protein
MNKFATVLAIVACVAPLAISQSVNLGGAEPATGGVCAEAYLGADTAHGGSDYGAAINAAVRAQPLTAPSAIILCKNGDHPVYTQIVFDRPIAFQATGSRLVPQSTLASTLLTVDGAALTSGSTTVAVPSTAGLTEGMAIGGIGISSSTYIASVGSGSITLSLPANIVLNGVVTTGSSTVTGLSSLAGVAAGQTVSGYGIPGGAKINSVNYADQSIGLSAPAVAGSASPTSITLGGTWASKIKAVATTPVIKWVFNPGALRNSEGQQIGGSMRGVWIAASRFRSLEGVQGVQIFGWDRLKVYDLQVENLKGSALVLGGYVPPTALNHATVRESFFYDSELRDCGEFSTGQPVVEMMTGTVDGHTSDEINQIGFVGGQVAFNYGEGVTIGTFNPQASGFSGPRLIWFTDNFQFEGGSHNAGAPIDAPVDMVHLIRANDVFFMGDEIAAPGYGKSLFRVDNAKSLSIVSSLVHAAGKPSKLTVSTNAKSNAVRFVGGPVGATSFDNTGAWDGVGAQIEDGALCRPCNVYLKTEGAVSSDGNTLTLASPFSGATVEKATMTIGGGGYYVNVTGVLEKLTTMGNDYQDVRDPEAKLLGLASPSVGWNVGSGIVKNSNINAISDYRGLSSTTPK